MGSLVALAFLACSTVPGTAWQESRAEEALPGGTDVRETRWTQSRPPGGAFDRIQVHRYRGSRPSVATLLYLPGTNMNGEVALEDGDHNLWLFLAGRGVDVFALDYRTHFVPSTGTADLSSMREWGMAAFVEDARAAAALARKETGRKRLFVAGFSRGVSLAWAFAATEPAEGVGGVVALDGGFKSHAPKDRYDLAAETKAWEAKGSWASDVSGSLGWETRQKMMTAAASDPGGPALDAKYATIGDQVSRILYGAWRPGGLANPVDGLSRPQVLAKLLAGYDRYYPTRQDVEGRSIADRDDDPATPLDDAWGEMKTPVLYFGSTGMGGDFLLNGIYTASKSGSPDVTLNVLESYGHLDVIAGDRARAEVFEPTLLWITRRAGP
jgi:pimeloyl-ACP methyl ester carboxylesterase